MLNLEKAYTVSVEGRSYAYYGDYYDSNTFYIEPSLQIAQSKDTNKPLFKIVQYQTSDASNGAGYCTFTTELAVSEEIRASVLQDIRQRHLSASPNIAPLQYSDGGKASFTFPDPTSGGTQSLTVATSALSDNRAAFLIQLDVKQMEAFINAYSQKGSKGFPVQYFETVDGITPAITVEISFDATTVRTYADKVTHHTWSKDEHDITDTISTTMPKDHNYVKVTPGDPAPPDEVIAKLKEWGQQVLTDELTRQIQRADALKQVKQDATWVSSFYRTYQQNQVVPWHIRPVAQMTSPVTDQLGWSQFFETVDMRQFTLLVNMSLNDSILPSADQVASITVNVDYPTLNAPNNSAVLTHSNASHQFSSPIAAGGNLEYNLEYVVTYQDRSQLRVVRNGLRASAYTISAPDVGILSVVFNTSQIPFVTQTQNNQVGVHGLEVDFFYKDLSGQDNPIEEKILFGFPMGEQNGKTIYEHDLTYTFKSKTSKPIYNGYVYTQKFILTDGTTVVADPITSNANLAQDDKAVGGVQETSRDNVIYLNSPVTPDSFGLYYFPPDQNNAVLALQMKVNQVEGDGSQKFLGQSDLSKAADHTASFNTATLSPGNQPYAVSGTMVTANGPIVIRPYITTDNYAYLFNDKRYFSVQINPQLIRFQEDSLALVQLDIKNTTAGATDITKSFLFNGGNPVFVYWGFNYDENQTPQYDYTITYSYTGKDPVKVSQKQQSTTVLTIPATPDPSHVSNALFVSKQSSR